MAQPPKTRPKPPRKRMLAFGRISPEGELSYMFIDATLVPLHDLPIAEQNRVVEQLRIITGR